MKKAIKTAANIFISRCAGQLGVFALFVMVGYFENISLGNMNLFISFISVFSSIASISLVYFQNEASNKSTVKSDMLNHGIQLALILGCSLSVFSLVLASMTLTDIALLTAVQVASLLYPLLSIISLLTFYLEGVGKSHIPSKSLFVSIILQTVIFYLLISFGVEVLQSAAYTFLIVDLMVAIYLVSVVRRDLNHPWTLMTVADLFALFTKGLPISIGVGVQKYLYSLIILALSVLGSFSMNLYAAITGIIFLLFLPQMGISHAASITVSENKIFGPDFEHYVILSVGYAGLVVLFILMYLPQTIELAYNFHLPADKVDAATFSAILFFIAQSASSFVMSLARAFNIIKLPQILSVLALLVAWIISRLYAQNVFTFINVTAYCLIISTIIVFSLMVKRVNSWQQIKIPL